MSIPLRQYWNLLVGYLRPQWLRALLLAGLLLGSIALQLLNPQVLRAFIDTAMAGGATEALLGAALLFVGVAITGQLITVCATYVGENVGWTATNMLRSDLAAHCLGLDMSFHKARTPGEIIERIDGDVNQLANFFSRFVIHMLGNLLLMVGVLALLFRESWQVGLALSIFALVATLFLIRLRSIAVPYWTAVREVSAQFFGFLGEQLAGTADVRANGATSYVMRRFYALLRGWLPVQRRAYLAGTSMWVATLSIFTLGNALAFGLGAYLWNSGAITIGTVYLIVHYTELLRQPIEQIRTQLQDLQQAEASIVRVRELLNTRSALEDGPGVNMPAGALAVAFEGVSFAYEVPSAEERVLSAEGRTDYDERVSQAEQLSQAHVDLATSDSALSTQHSALSTQHSALDLVLHNLTFTLAPGRVLGLLGRTGSGKTTLARLLLRLYDPTAGAVRLGDAPVRQARLRELRQRVGMVTQEVQLFHASVRDNLTFFNPQIADERIVAVLEDLGLGPWLRALPAGLDSELAAGGGGLSAGEAQLLAFARLFLQDPGLVILDEASSRLDPATEQLLERAVAKLLAGRTGIIIAHRLGTVQRADEIMILERGQIAEFGERVRLAADPGSRFAGLLRTGMEEVLA